MGNAILSSNSLGNDINFQVKQLANHVSSSYSNTELEFSRLLSLANIDFFDSVTYYPMIWGVIHTLRVVPIPGRIADYYTIALVHQGYIDDWYAEYDVDTFDTQSLFVPDIKPSLFIPGPLFSTDMIVVQGNTLQFDFVEWSVFALEPN